MNAPLLPTGLPGVEAKDIAQGTGYIPEFGTGAATDRIDIVAGYSISGVQSYSLIIRDIFYDALMRLPFFNGFTGRKCKQLQWQPEYIPALGIYIIREEMTPDGDANAGNIGFIHMLRLGFSVVIYNNDPILSEKKLDEAFWVIMNGLWTDPYITNMIDTRTYGHPEYQVTPDNVRFEGIPRSSRQNIWGNNTLTNELPIAEMQYDVTVTYRTDFEPVITDDLLKIHSEVVPMRHDKTVPSVEEVERVIVEYDMSTEPLPEADSDYPFTSKP